MMDTILQPRHLCTTATDESSSEEEGKHADHHNKKDSTCSSKITVIPNVGSFEEVLEVEEDEKEDDGEDDDEETTKIVCPTARFLQVKPKKVSSFDLLVRPPKRQRFIRHPSREDVMKGATFNQKTNPSQVSSCSSWAGKNAPRKKKSPVMECIYFENEKLRYRQTKSGNWSSSSSSASPRNSRNPNPQNNGNKSSVRGPVSLPLVLSEENTLREIELSGGYSQDINGGGNKKCEGGRTGSGRDRRQVKQEQEEDSSHLKGRAFPISEQYAFYMQHWTPSVQQIFKEFENEKGMMGMLKDENLNFLVDKKAGQVVGEFETSSPPLPTQKERSPRRIKKPLYRLRNLNETGNGTNEHQGPPPPSVFLKESDFNSLMELSLFQQDEKKRNMPTRKKLKSNPPVDYRNYYDGNNDEEVIRSSRKCEQPEQQRPVYQIFNELTGERQIPEIEVESVMEEMRLPPSSLPSVPPSYIQDVLFPPHVPPNLRWDEAASSIFRTCYEDQSSMFDGTAIVGENHGEFSIIHHPDLRDLQLESTTVLDEASFPMNNPSGSAGDASLEEELEFIDVDDDEYSRPESALMPGCSFNHMSGTRSSPLTIFLSDSIMGGSRPDHPHQMRFEMGESPFTNFGIDNESNFSQENDGEWTIQSRIEDVTDSVGDEEVIDSVIRMVGSGGAEMETLFWAKSTTSSNNNTPVGRNSSGPCELVDGFTDKRKDSDKRSSREMICISRKSLDPQEIEAQEFLLQPKPKLNLSSSMHSCLERGCSLLERRSTVAMFVDKNKTKSDYFVGKIKGGPSKTFLIPELLNNNHNRQNSKIKNKNSETKLPVCQDSGNDDNNNNGTTDIDGNLEEPLDNQNQQQQSPLDRSSSSIAIAVINAKRKVSVGNRVSNAIHDKIKRGMSPPIPDTERGEMQQLCFPPPPQLRRSSSSSSNHHHQISVKIKAPPPVYKKPPVTTTPPPKKSKKTSKKPPPETTGAKPILKKEKRPNIFMRILGRIFGISDKTKEASNKNNNSKVSKSRTPEDIIPSVPSSVIKRADKGIVHHTDSKELYRERRMKFFSEQKEFRDDSLATYAQAILSHDIASGAHDFLSIPIPPRIPVNYFQDKSVNFCREVAAAEDACNNNNVVRTTSSNNPRQNKNMGENVVPVPVRLAKSESALVSPIVDPTEQRGGGGTHYGRIARANLVLQFPPFVQVLAAAMTRHSRSVEGQATHFERVKKDLKKPLKGILKKEN